MSLGRILAIAARLMKQLSRDRRAIALVFLAPLMVMTLLAVLLGLEESPPRIAIQVSGLVSIYVDRFEEVLENPEEEDDRFEVVYLPDGMSAREAIAADLADAVMVFSPTFVEDRASGRRSRLDLFVEGADPMRTAAILSRFRKATPDAVTGFPKLLPADCGVHCAETIPDAPPEVELTRLYGDDLDKNMDFFTPVLPAFFVFFFVFLLSGLTFLRERVSGTAERLLASPVGKAELVTGYVLGFLPPALLQASVVVAFARFALGGPWGGATAVLAMVLLALVAECTGVFVSAFAKSEFQVFQFIPIVLLPQLLVCGLIWPVSDFPPWLEPLAWAFPLTYAMDAIRDSAIRQMGLADTWPQLAAIALFAIAATAAASASIRRRI